MYLIDLHCDTLYKSVVQNIPLDDESLDIKINGKIKNDNSLFCYAIWSPDDLSQSQAEVLFDKAYKKLLSECTRLNINLIDNQTKINSIKENKRNAIFTVENSNVLNGKIENVSKLAKCGVKLMTLTWNNENSCGFGALNQDGGIKKFGKKVLKEMNKYNIIADVSHTSDKLFYDIISISKQPVVASHSDSRKITNNMRNLTDEQFKIICQKGGIVGLNFHNEFLNDNPEKASMYDILKHTEHFMSLGGENHISLGSDFDGCDLPCDINGTDSLGEIYNMFLRENYNETAVKKIFFQNALKFFENFDIY